MNDGWVATGSRVGLSHPKVCVAIVETVLCTLVCKKQLGNKRYYIKSIFSVDKFVCVKELGLCGNLQILDMGRTGLGVGATATNCPPINPDINAWNRRLVCVL